MDGKVSRAKPGPLETIEQEGDAARVALARKLARKAFDQPSTISQKQLTRIGNIGLPHFFGELGKLWGRAIQSERSEVSSAGSGNAAPPNPQRLDATTDAGSSKAEAVAAAPVADPKAPRPPHETEGWSDLCCPGWQPDTHGILFGMLTGLVVIAGLALTIYLHLL